MKQYIIATHGFMAYGVTTVIEMLVGVPENYTVINAYTDECKDPYPEIEKVVNEHPEDEIIIMTDILGGSVNNNAMQFLNNKNVHIVTGINLPLVISILTSDTDVPAKETIEGALKEAKEYFIYCNPLVEKAEDEDDF